MLDQLCSGLLHDDHDYANALGCMLTFVFGCEDHCSICFLHIYLGTGFIGGCYHIYDVDINVDVINVWNETSDENLVG